MATDRDVSQESQASREFEAEMRAHAQSIGKRLEELRAAPKDFAYIAGLFDGEITFSIRPPSPNSYNLELRWNKSDYLILSFVKDIFGGSVRKVKPQPFYRFDVWEWHISGENAYRAVRKVYPFLRVKKEDATICLAFWERYSVGYKKRKRASNEQQSIGALYCKSSGKMGHNWDKT